MAKKLKSFKVIYEIDVEAVNAHEAAKMVEDIFKTNIYRPVFTVEDEHKQKVLIDLELEKIV